MARTEMVHTRMTATERRALLLVARQEDRNPSETLRELVRQAARERGLWLIATQQVTRGKVQ